MSRFYAYELLSSQDTSDIGVEQTAEALLRRLATDLNTIEIDGGSVDGLMLGIVEADTVDEACKQVRARDFVRDDNSFHGAIYPISAED